MKTQEQATCGHVVELDIPRHVEQAEVLRRRRLTAAEVCLDCWTQMYLGDALSSALRAALPALTGYKSDRQRAAAQRVRHALFESTARLVGERQAKADQNELDRLTEVLGAIRRESDAGRWLGWRWHTPEALIADVTARLDQQRAANRQEANIEGILQQSLARGGWGVV
jgi:hypothetical protein